MHIHYQLSTYYVNDEQTFDVFRLPLLVIRGRDTHTRDSFPPRVQRCGPKPNTPYSKHAIASRSHKTRVTQSDQPATEPPLTTLLSTIVVLLVCDAGSQGVLEEAARGVAVPCVVLSRVLWKAFRDETNEHEGLIHQGITAARSTRGQAGGEVSSETTKPMTYS